VGQTECQMILQDTSVSRLGIGRGITSGLSLKQALQTHRLCIVGVKYRRSRWVNKNF